MRAVLYITSQACSPFFRYDPLRGEAKDVQTTVANETEVCRGGDGDARVEERRILDGVAIEALGTKLEHAL